MINSMDVQLGKFHGVVAVGVTEDCVSILNSEGVEHMLPISPAHDPYPQPVGVYGEFGDLEKAETGEVLRHLQLTDIKQVEILPLWADPDEDFHTRVLRLRGASGLNLTWELFCDGKL